MEEVPLSSFPGCWRPHSSWEIKGVWQEPSHSQSRVPLVGMERLLLLVALRFQGLRPCLFAIIWCISYGRARGFQGSSFHPTTIKDTDICLFFLNSIFFLPQNRVCRGCFHTHCGWVSGAHSYSRVKEVPAVPDEFQTTPHPAPRKSGAEEGFSESPAPPGGVPAPPSACRVSGFIEQHRHWDTGTGVVG